MIPLFKQNSKILWQGEAYQANTKINLEKTLQNGKTYVMDMFGISSVYHIYFVFVYNNKINNIQFSYNDGTNYFRYRFDILSGGNVININAESINNAQNTKITSIYEINH